MFKWFHTTRLILNRPFIPNNQVISTASGDKSAYSLCSDAADNIVAVVTTLEQTHGIFRCSYNVLFTSVLTLSCPLRTCAYTSLQDISSGCYALLDQLHSQGSARYGES